MRAPESPVLPRVLGTRDVVLMMVSLVVAPMWLATAAGLGPASLIFWAAGLTLFFVPSCLAVVALSARLPGEGGLYLWTRTAFGEGHGFVVGWVYWITNVFYLPSVLLLAASWSLHVRGRHWAHLADSVTYSVVFCLAVIWTATLLNVVGLGRVKWLSNVGGLANWLVLMLLCAAACFAAGRFGSATNFASSEFVPRVDSGTMGVFATIAFAYVGVEAGAIVGAEIRESARTLQKAVWYAAGLIVCVYVAGTFALLVAIPPQQIDPVAGIADAFDYLEARTSVPALGLIGAILLTTSQVGNVSSWITTTARLPFVAGIDRYLPSAFARVHRRWNTPYVALMLQALMVSAALLAAVAGSTVREAFQELLGATVVLAFLPLLYMFAAWPVVAARRQGLRFDDWLVWGIAMTGFGVTVLALGLAILPPADSPHPMVFVAKVVTGAVGLVAVGVARYFVIRRRSRAARCAQAPSRR